MPMLPGQITGATYTPRNVLVSSKGLIYERGIIDASLAYDGANTYPSQILAGTPMAQIAASKMWVPCNRTQVNMTGATATAITVDNARFFKVGQVITVGGDTTITITAINYTTNVITIASTTVADNDVFFAEDGSGICRGILGEFIELKDPDGTWRNKSFSKLIVAGEVDYTQCLGDIANIRTAMAALATTTGNPLRNIVWNDEVGQV